jgi:hypothetical protein
VKSLDNPSLSANAFTYEGYAAAEPAMSVSGYVFWDSYRFRAAMSSPGGGSMGLVFGYQDPKNYYLMRWAPAGEDRSASSPRQLCRVSDGVLKVLAESPGGYRPGQWYTLEVRLHGSRIQARIDDHPLFDVTEPRMLSGKVGLYTDCRKSSTEECCRFDDVEVRSLHDVLDDFGTCSTIDWNTVGGSWAIRDGTYQVMAPRAARSLLGCADWKNYTVGADLSPSCGQWIGLVAAYLDESSYLLYRVSTQGQGAQELVQVRNGQAEVLERRDARPAEWRTTANHVDLSVNAGVACARVNGTTQLERWLGENPAGKAGLYAEATDFASFDNLEVQFESRPRVLLSVNPVFAHEKSMSNWAAADSDWLSRSTMLDGKVFDVRVHRLQFFGNVEFSLNVVQATSLSQLRMTIGADDEDPREGHHFLIRKASRASASSGADTAPLVAPDSPAASGDAWEAVLLWRDEQLASAVLDEATAPSHVWFRRVGSWLVGYANSRPVIQARTTESGRGRRLSYSHVGGRVRPETAQIFTDHAYSYSFRQASTDWRIGSGTWEVTNRWQCDPRWTFFAGSARRLACLWNKRRFRGDLCVDFAAAIKMDRNRGGRYEYASDINVTVGADGQDLTSGYSFLFGGFDNSRTCIVRKGQIVAQSSQKIPTYTNIHRRWFHVKVVRRGNKLLYWVDDVPLLSYEDPEPLTGDQVAVWTWNNGLMVAQVRISSSDGGEFEAPDRTLPARTACIYDQ